MFVCPDLGPGCALQPRGRGCPLLDVSLSFKSSSTAGRGKVLTSGLIEGVKYCFSHPHVFSDLFLRWPLCPVTRPNPGFYFLGDQGHILAFNVLYCHTHDVFSSAMFCPDLGPDRALEQECDPAPLSC